MDVQQLFKDSMNFAAKAVTHDLAGEHELAKFFYIEASEALLKVISMDQSFTDAKVKVHQYMERAEYLAATGKFIFLFLINWFNYFSLLLIVFFEISKCIFKGMTKNLFVLKIK